MIVGGAILIGYLASRDKSKLPQEPVVSQTQSISPAKDNVYKSNDPRITEQNEKKSRVDDSKRRLDADAKQLVADEKAAEGLLGFAVILKNQGKNEAALEKLKDILYKYPRTKSAEKASELFEKWKS